MDKFVSVERSDLFQVGTEELQGSKSNENLAKLSKGECWAIDFFNIS